MKVAFSAIGIRDDSYKWSWTPDNPAPADLTRKLLTWAKAVGFDGFELEDHWVDFYNFSDRDIKRYKKLLDETGMPVPCLKAPGKNLCHPKIRDDNKKRLLRAVEIASLLGAHITSVNMATPSALYGVPSTNTLGVSRSVASSRDAQEEDFERTAEGLREAARKAAPLGISIAIEVHQNSLADNGTSTFKLLDMIGEKNVGANPDLGNILTTYDVPEEPWDEAIEKLAPRSVWWHCKNMNRIYVPEVNRSVFVRTTLDQGDIDYRYCIKVMHKAGYQGYILIEGGGAGDGLAASKRSLDYVRSILADLE